MGKAVFSNVVKSNITSLITDLVWFGAPVGATAQWDDRLSGSSSIGISALDRVWVDRPNVLQITVQTMLGDSGVLAVRQDERFDLLYDYIAPMLGEQGYFAPGINQSVLSQVSLNFAANQVCTGTFSHTIYRPSADLIEWFDIYASETEVPMGDGTQFAALGTDDVVVTHGAGQIKIDGIESINITAPLQVDQLETIYKTGLFMPRLPLEINIGLRIMNDYFTLNEELFTDADQLNDLSVWKFKLIAPKILNVEQDNQTGTPRSWSINLQAKNLIKEL